MSASKRILFIEPFFSGSHRAFAEGYAGRSRHRVTLLTLPGSHWKWRQRGAHLSLRSRAAALAGETDVLLASGTLNLAEFLGTLPAFTRVPSLAYFHENQLTYPAGPNGRPDPHAALGNISTALAAFRVVFNSAFHRDDFLAGIDAFLRLMPDHRPRRLGDVIRERSTVVHPGIDCAAIDAVRRAAPGLRPTTILWNHRWEHDKEPEVFLRVLSILAAKGLPFRVHLVGQRFRRVPPPLAAARELLGDRLVTFGFVDDRQAYLHLLRESDVVVSTARQEFYGIALLEAAYAGAYPLAPDRLAYPGIYPREHLYSDEDDLADRLTRIVAGGSPPGWDRGFRDTIRADHDLSGAAALLDDLIDRCVGNAEADR